MSTARAPKRSVPLLSQLPADRKGVPSVRPFPEPILPMVYYALADDCERVVASE